MPFGIVEHPFLVVRLGPDKDAVDVTTDPGLGVPDCAAAGIGQLPFELIGQHHEVQAIVVYAVALQVGRKRGLAVLVGWGR